MFDNTTVTNYTKWADVSVYLSMDEYQNERYYTWTNETKKSRVLYMTNEAVKWAQAYLLGTEGFDESVNYLYSLFGKWMLRAINIANTGSGLVVGTPVIPMFSANSGTVTLQVGTLGSPIPANTNQYTNPILSGRTLIIILDNVVIQTVGTPITYSFNSGTGTITFSNNLSLNQVLTIIYI